MGCSSRSLSVLPGFAQVPGQHTFHCDGFDLFANPFSIEETVEG
jgi:hypothetical protein